MTSSSRVAEPFAHARICDPIYDITACVKTTPGLSRTAFEVIVHGSMLYWSCMREAFISLADCNSKHVYLIQSFFSVQVDFLLHAFEIQFVHNFDSYDYCLFHAGLKF